MSTSSSFKIPKVLAINKNYLVLEFLESKGENCWRKFGKNLAELHSCYGLSFGLNSDNYIGTLNQKNLFYDKWCDFYINNRIIPLIEGLDYDKKIVNKLEKLMLRLDVFFDNNMKPCLLHGASFYESYYYYAPNTSKSRERIEILKIYPLLVHAKLFGKSYLEDIRLILNNLL